MSAYFAHPSAIIDPGAVIGDGCKIWHFCHVSSGVAIGNACVFGQNVFVDAGVSIGAGCKIQNNVSVYKGVTLEDNVFCGPSCVFTNVLNPRAAVERKQEFAPTLVKRGATIGANATIVCGNTVGEFALIGAGSVVTKDVPAYALVVGAPAKVIGWACECGEVLVKLGAVGECRCKRCQRIYRVSDTGIVEQRT